MGSRDSSRGMSALRQLKDEGLDVELIHLDISNSAHPGLVKTDLGTDQAPMRVEEGAKTAIRLATLPPNGPTGKFFHFNDEIPC